MRSASEYQKNETIFESDPSSFRFQVEAENRFNRYISELTTDKSSKNVIKESDQSESKNLASELRRMRSIKYGKLLLEV